MSRFKPVSAGIVGVWDYEFQEFQFGDGRLVLRGPNGSGKTKALELLMPFVLDGSIDARRLDPFSNKDRTMQSNLLYGGESERRAYCWLTFANDDDHVTVGVGMRASKHKARPDTWFFVTDRRVGSDLPLVDSARVPMTKKAMRELLGPNECFETRDAHRAAVNRRLFGFDGDRYEAMIELILTLRRPQLAKELDPESLSKVLSEGLRTVDSDQLRSSAEAFENLEQTQRDLSELERANKAASDMLTVWRTYLRTRAHARVKHAIHTEQQLRQTQEAILDRSREVNDQTAQAEQHHATARAHQSTAEAEQQAIDALKARDAYQNQGQLDDARKLAEQSRQTMQRSTKDREHAQTLHARDVTSHEQATQAQGRRVQAVHDAERDAGRLADRLTIKVSEPIVTDETRVDVVALNSDLTDALTAAQAMTTAQVTQQHAEEQLQERIAEAALAASEHLTRSEQAVAALTQWRSDVLAWHSACDDAVREPLDRSQLEGAENAAALGATVDAAWTPLREQWSGDLRVLEQAQRDHKTSLAERAQTIQRIEAEHDDAPPTPPGRPADRAERTGLPLWRAVAFAPGVDSSQHAGIEGALLASGLLDAWIDIEEHTTPDDVHLLARGQTSEVSLASLLIAEESDAVPAERIHGILRGIPLSDADVFIDASGSFRLGPLAGQHRPDRARYIGATAREQHRAERVAALQVEQAAEQRELDAAQAEYKTLRSTREALDAHRRRLPGDASVQTANTRASKAEAVLSAKREQESRAQRQRDAAHREAALAEQRFTAVCSERNLPSDPNELRERQRLVVDLRSTLTTVDTSRDALHTATQAVQEASERANRSRDSLATAQEREARDAEASQGAAERYRVLKESLGADLQQIQAQIETHSTAQHTALRDAAQAARRKDEARGLASKASGRVEALTERLPDLQSNVARAEAELKPFRDLSIQRVLDVDSSDDPLPERLHRAVMDAAATDERIKATETLLNNRIDRLDEALGSRFEHKHETLDGVVIVRIRDEEGETDLGTFLTRNSERLDRLKDLLHDNEQQIFEDHLLTSLITSLRERIEETRTLCTQMDDAMRERKLASGKFVGIQWRSLPNPDPARKKLLSLLGFGASFLSAAELGQVRGLLSEEVQAERRANPDRTYLRILEQALDYRTWHRFDLHLYDRSGQGTRLTKSAHGKLSGGEKAATVHLPLFAAAHAHFNAATLPCPRLIALDEAFAGIDETGTPQLLRLAAEFDLDWFLTGHNLWVTEAFLPDVMHYDLAHDESTRAVSAWPIRWNGNATIEGAEALA